MTVWTENQGFNAFDEMLDDVEGTVTVCGCSFSPSAILKELDPIAYQEQASAWFDMLADDDILVEGYTV